MSGQQPAREWKDRRAERGWPGRAGLSSGGHLGGGSQVQPDPAARPGRIAWWLWLLLAGSLAFFALVRVYVRHEEANMLPLQQIVPYMQTAGPTQPVRAAALDLAWDEVPGAAIYRLSIASVTGQIVVEALPVEGTGWFPPEEVQAALVRGEYRWEVEAQDENGVALAKSAPTALRVM